MPPIGKSLAIGLLFAAALARTQSTIPTVPTIAVVVNGASFQPVITGGSWVSILGAGLSQVTRVWDPGEALPTTLAGVSVAINHRRAAIAFVSPTQLNVLAQPDFATGRVPVTVTNAAGTSRVYFAEMFPFTPAFFLLDDRRAVATRRDGTLILPAAPARPGEVVTLWGTGFGPTRPPAPVNRIVTELHAVRTLPLVFIGGLPADVLDATLAQGSAGVYRVTVRVPGLAPSGDLAVVAELPGAASPANVFLALQR